MCGCLYLSDGLLPRKKFSACSPILFDPRPLLTCPPCSHRKPRQDAGGTEPWGAHGSSTATLRLLRRVPSDRGSGCCFRRFCTSPVAPTLSTCSAGHHTLLCAQMDAMEEGFLLQDLRFHLGGVRRGFSCPQLHPQRQMENPILRVFIHPPTASRVWVR